MTLKSINLEVPAQAPAAALLIVPNHSRKAGSTAVLEFMARIWPLTARRDELVYVFSRADTNTTASCTLAQRVDSALRTMLNYGKLSCSGEGADRVWSFVPSAEQAALPKKAAVTADAPAYVGVRAPARDYGDVMKSPVYMPQHQLVLRSGAQDFQRCPSRGTRC
ncbi:MAG: hypothetical protein NTZ64_15180 [Polaromonas sp.]|nr:hypothetical protein [Polaromonas sp.]